MCLFLACLLLPVLPAAAQGTDGLVADPITSGDFDDYIRMLRLDHSQRLIAEDLHEHYKEMYAAFRDREISKVVEKLRQLETESTGMLPSREKVDELFEIRTRVESRSRTLDRNLFGELQLILTEPQMSSLQRVLRARERKYYQFGAQMGGNARTVDLVELVDSLRLSAGDEDLIVTDLIDYEIGITGTMKNMHEQAFEMIMKMFDAAEEAGLGGTEITDPEVAQRAMEVVQGVMAEAEQDRRRLERKARSLTMRSKDLIVQRLPVEPAERLNVLYRREAYPQVYPDSGSVDRMIQAALELDDLSASQMAAIEAAGESYRSRHDSLSREMVRATDDLNETRSTFSFDNEGWQEHQEKMQRLRQQRQELNGTTAKAVLDALGEPMAEKVRGIRGPTTTGWAQAGPTEGSVAVEVAVEYTTDAYVPAPISAREFALYADRLDITDDLRDIAEFQFADYLERYETLAKEHFPTLIEERMAAFYREGRNDLDLANRLNAGRAEAKRLVIELDETLFDDLGAVLPEGSGDLLDGVRVSRDRVIHSMRDGRGALDLCRMLDQANFGAEDRRGAENILREYEKRVVPILHQRQTHQIERELQQLKTNRLYQNAGDIPEERQEIWARAQEIMAEVDAAIRADDGQLKELSHEMYPKILAALPPRGAEKFRDRYNRTAHPSVYPDPENAAPIIRQARGLTDLADDQRAELDSIAAEHRQRHDELCQVLISVSDRDPMYAMTADDAESWWERRQKKVKAEFERREYNATMVRRVRKVLTPEQAGRVGGLGDD